jgi:hypothetical protein
MDKNERQECDHRDCPRSCWQQDPNKVHQGWEEQFDVKFADNYAYGTTIDPRYQSIKAFIAGVVAQAETRGYERGLNERKEV